MRADATERPTISDVVSHPILQRALVTGQAALTPEPEHWLTQLLTDFQVDVSAVSDAADVEML
jgi:hypothetical protein